LKQQTILKSQNSFKREHFQLKETIVTIIAENDYYIEIAKNEIIKRRNEIEQFIKKDDFFEVTYEPYEPPIDAPESIQKMCNSSEKFKIGPMSTVAGTISEYAVRAMKKAGAKHAIVDNGGDISVYSKYRVNIGIYTGNKVYDQLALQIQPTGDKILGICTSSGWIGHSHSFGNTDAVTIISNNVSLADAAATSLGNQVKQKSDINSAFKILQNKPDIICAIIFINGYVGLWGKVPKFVYANIPYKIITKDGGIT